MLAAARAGDRRGLSDSGGRPLIERVLESLRASGAERLSVVLGANAPDLLAGSDLGAAQAVVCERWAAGSVACVRAGLDALGACGAVVIARGDRPLARELVERLLARRGREFDVVRATWEGAPAGVLVAESRFLPRLRALDDAAVLDESLGQASVCEVACDDLVASGAR